MTIYTTEPSLALKSFFGRDGRSEKRGMSVYSL